MGKPFIKKYAVLGDGTKLVLDTPESAEKYKEHIVTKKVFDDTPEPQAVSLLPKVVRVRNKKTDQVFSVQRDHYEKYRGSLEIVDE
ncbi:hypothetical protein [Vibrio phage Artemius]|nr:hypothetical protein [Vibrio phage Artemius]